MGFNNEFFVKKYSLYIDGVKYEWGSDLKGIRTENKIIYYGSINTGTIRGFIGVSDINGGFLWVKEINDIDLINVVIECDNGDLLCKGIIWGIEAPLLYMARFSSEGIILWQKEYNLVNYGHVNDKLHKLPNDQYILVPSEKKYIIKLSGNGEIIKFGETNYPIKNSVLLDERLIITRDTREKSLWIVELSLDLDIIKEYELELLPISSLLSVTCNNLVKLNDELTVIGWIEYEDEQLRKMMVFSIPKSIENSIQINLVSSFSRGQEYQCYTDEFIISKSSNFSTTNNNQSNFENTIINSQFNFEKSIRFKSKEIVLNPLHTEYDFNENNNFFFLENLSEGVLAISSSNFNTINNCITIEEGNQTLLNKEVIEVSLKEVSKLTIQFLPLHYEVRTNYSLDISVIEENLCVVHIPISLTNSTITTNKNTIKANGVEPARVTVQLKEETGENIVVGGETVVITTSFGELTATTDNGDGTYTATLTSNVAGSTILSFTVNGETAPITTTVKFAQVEKGDGCFIKRYKWKVQEQFTGSTNIYAKCFTDEILVYGNLLKPSSGYISKLDIYGDHIWSKRLVEKSIIKKIIKCDNGDYIVLACSTEEKGSNEAKLILIRFNKNGTTIWKKVFNQFITQTHNFQEIVKLPNDTYFIYTQYPQHFIKIDGAGNIVKSVSTNFLYPQVINSTSEEIFILYKKSGASNPFSVLKLNNNLDIIDNIDFQFSVTDFPNGFTASRVSFGIKKIDGHYIITGIVGSRRFYIKHFELPRFYEASAEQTNKMKVDVIDSPFGYPRIITEKNIVFYSPDNFNKGRIEYVDLNFTHLYNENIKKDRVNFGPFNVMDHLNGKYFFVNYDGTVGTIPDDFNLGNCCLSTVSTQEALNFKDTSYTTSSSNVELTETNTTLINSSLIIEDLAFEVEDVCTQEIPEELVISESAQLQSTNLYVQAAGSTGSDGSVSGIHLRWLLKGYLGETHLPKGNYTTKTHHFNKPDDFVRVFRAPYTPKYLTLDFQNESPSVVDHSKYLWIYRVNGVSFYISFKNAIKYNVVKSTINPLLNSYGFIQQYGNEIIEIDQRKQLSFAVTLKSASSSATIKAEVLSVENNTLRAQQYVTARKEFTGEGRFEEENIRTIRYKANYVKQIQFELYSEALAFNQERKNWSFVGEFALTTDDVEAENRLEKLDGSTPIHGQWQRFNDGETVNKDNYIDRWKGEETEPYSTNPKYYEYYDRRLKTTIKRYLELSDDDTSNPTAMEAIPFSSELPEGVTSQDQDTQDISNLTMIQLASLDYHMARMLGLGHIDTDIDRSQISKKYVYLVEYKTINNINNGLADEDAEEIQHLYLSLPTAMTDERLPIPVDLLKPVFGTNNSDNENLNKLLDEKGYMYDGKQRFISLISEELPENQTNISFFEDRTQFSTSLATTPVYIGLEYKLFDPTNPNVSTWQRPELSNTSKYKNLGTNNNETVPLLIPEPNETLFLHKENEEGWHRYSSYGINWFSRSKMSTVFWDVETRFKVQNRLLPPSNVKACLIVEESPLMLTSSAEQDLLETITNDDKTLVRLTFDHHINQDKITYQINEDSMGSFTDPLDQNAIFRDDKEVFADKVNIFFRNKPPKTVSGKIKSIEAHINNTLAIIRTESYELVSTGDKVIPNIPSNELSHFVGSLFIFNETKYIIHEVNASTVAEEGPVFTVYKELVSQAMLTGEEPDPTIPLELPKLNEDTIVTFNSVENMLTENNWQMGTASTANKLDFQITIGDNWNIHREVIDEVNINGDIEKVVEKSRGIWETARIEEFKRPNEPKHVGMYKITFSTPLAHHSQFSSHNVDWYQGIVRIHTQNNPTKKRKILEVVSMENIGTSNPLIVYAIDPQYPANVDDINTVEGFDPILIGNQEVNFYPGYRVYLYNDDSHYLTKKAILPSRGEGIKYSILGLQSIDPAHPEGTTNPDEWYKSKISKPALFFAQEVITPEVPLLSNGEEFIYATRPDTFGKSTFSLTPGFKHLPHGVQFYRSNDDAVLNALYKPSTVIEIKEKLKEDINPNFHLVKRWQNLLGFNLEYSETYQTNGEFFLYPEDETGYRFPKPDKYQLYKAINDVLEYRNENYSTSYTLLNLGDEEDDANNGVIGTLNFSDIVIPSLESEGIEDDITFIEFVKSAVFNVFTPLTEIPLMYDYINDSEYQPIAKKQVIRDKNGGLLPPSSPDFDMAPMAKIMSQEMINKVPGAETRILFTDFNLDGTSNNLYFYAIREMGSTMQLGDYSPILGPVKLVNTKPPQSPDIRRVLPILQNDVLGISPSISIEINTYPKIQNIKQVKVYRTLEANKALSVRTMDLIKTIDLDADGQLLNNVWTLKDDFTDLGYVPYGDPLYYRVTVLREVEYADGSNYVGNNHPKVIEYVPSESSKLLISSIVENTNPESPVLEYNFDTNLSDNSLIHNVILKWNKMVHNGNYHVYQMNTQGNWVKIHTFTSNADDVQLLLADTSLENGTLSIQNEDGNPKYYHFKVIAENSIGMMSTEDKILTIPNTNSIGGKEGIGNMIIENTNIVR